MCHGRLRTGFSFELTPISWTSTYWGESSACESLLQQRRDDGADVRALFACQRVELGDQLGVELGGEGDQTGRLVEAALFAAIDGYHGLAEFGAGGDHFAHQFLGVAFCHSGLFHEFLSRELQVEEGDEKKLMRRDG